MHRVSKNFLSSMFLISTVKHLRHFISFWTFFFQFRQQNSAQWENPLHVPKEINNDSFSHFLFTLFFCLPKYHIFLVSLFFQLHSILLFNLSDAHFSQKNFFSFLSVLASLTEFLLHFFISIVFVFLSTFILFFEFSPIESNLKKNLQLKWKKVHKIFCLESTKEELFFGFFSYNYVNIIQLENRLGLVVPVA